MVEMTVWLMAVPMVGEKDNWWVDWTAAMTAVAMVASLDMKMAKRWVARMVASKGLMMAA